MTSAYGGAGPDVLACAWILTTVTTILVALRIYTRIKITPVGGWALFWTLVSWFLALITMILATVAVAYGLGNHINVVEEAGTLEPALLYTTISFCFFSVAVGVGKAAVCSYILLVQKGTTKTKGKYFLIFLAVVTALLGVGDVFTLMFECDPSDGLWNPSIKANCNENLNRYYATFAGSWCAFTDLCYALYPVTLIWPLKLPLRLKCGICCILGLGVLACVAACLRTYYLNVTLNSTDVTYSYKPLLYWGFTEIWLVLICTSIPALWPLLKPVVSKFMPISTEYSDESRRHISPFALLRQKVSSNHQRYSVRLESNHSSHECVQREATEPKLASPPPVAMTPLSLHIAPPESRGRASRLGGSAGTSGYTTPLGESDIGVATEVTVHHETTPYDSERVSLSDGPRLEEAAPWERTQSETGLSPLT